MSYKNNGGQKVGAGEHIAVDLFKERQAGQVATAGCSGRDVGSHSGEEQCRTAGGLGTDAILLEDLTTSTLTWFRSLILN